MKVRNVQIFPLSLPECVGHGCTCAAPSASTKVIFIAGILTGISLTIAGSVLRHQPARGGSVVGGGAGGSGGRSQDLTVLIYIGCLVGLVCSLLLAVQCCVRRNVKRRKRALRAGGGQASGTGRRGLATSALPPPHQPPPPPPAQGVPRGGDIPMQELQYQPLLVRLVQQQATASSSSSGNQRLAAAPPLHYHRPYRDPEADLETSRSGTPWWRRRSDGGRRGPPQVGAGVIRGPGVSAPLVAETRR